MASFTMTASFLSAAGVSLCPAVNPRRSSPMVARADANKASAQDVCKYEDKGSSNRRAVLMVAAAAAAACVFGSASGQGIAFAADGEPKRGTPEAKKKYSPVCVTMPTARICRN